MGLAELKAELAGLEPQLAEVDSRLDSALAEKETAASVYEGAKAAARLVNSERDPIRSRVMWLQREIGVIEGIPTQGVGG